MFSRNLCGLFLFSLSFSFFSAPSSFAAPSGAAVLKIDPSARSFALGKSNAITSQGAAALSANPANTLNIDQRYEVFSAFSSLMQDATYGHVAGVLNRSVTNNNWIDAMGFALTRMSVSGLEGRDSSGSKTADFKSQDTVMSFSFAGGVTDKLNVGLTGKMITAEIAGYKASASLAGDLGMSYKFKGFGRDLALGAALNNLGSGMRFISQKDPLPTAFNVGLAAAVGPFNLVGGISRLMNEGTTDASLGMEYNIGVASLRAGYSGGSTVSSSGGDGASALMNGLTTGVGFKFSSMRLDYALGQSNADLGLSHRVALTLEFGRKAQ